MKPKIILILSIPVFLSGCSLMQKMMMNKMAKMSGEEKMEMMQKMMANGDDHNCGEMMKGFSGIHNNDSLSMADMATVMMPKCLGNILYIVEDDKKTQFLLTITEQIIKEGYNNLPAQDKDTFKLQLFKTIEGLE